MSSQTLITCSLWMKISQPDMMVSPFRQFKSAMNSSLQWSAVIALGKRRCYVTAAVSWKLHFKLTKQKLPKSEFIFQPESRWRRVGDKDLKSRREILPKAISVLFPYNLTSTADFLVFPPWESKYLRMWECGNFFQQKCFDSLLARAAHHIFASFFSWRKRRAARPNVMSLEIKSAILLTKSAWGLIDCRTIQLSSDLLDAQTIKIYLVILKLKNVVMLPEYQNNTSSQSDTHERESRQSTIVSIVVFLLPALISRGQDGIQGWAFRWTKN